MKKIAKPLLFGVILIVCLFVISTSCKKKTDDTTPPPASAECSSNITLCGSHVFMACCTTTECYYLVDNSARFNCNGFDCVAAANQLVSQYCGYGLNFSEKELLTTVEKVLAAIK